MKWIRTLTAVVATLGLTGVAQAGIFNSGTGLFGASKCCGCASTCQPSCCKPTITRPCHTSVHVYQRKCSDIKPPCCNTCCAPQSCCAPAAQACAPAPQACAAPAPQTCAPAPQACAAPAPQTCAPAPQACAAPAPACGPVAQNCCAPAPQSCCQPTQGCQTRCCDADPCEVAQLIYDSQTACYAKDRRKAIHKLGDRFDCYCNPEIMCAFIYALNDSDERVRWKAADEIGDQLRKNECCCSPEIISALTCALADCDKGVRKQAEEALEACGYEVVDGCCDVCDSCTSGCGACGGAAAPVPAPGGAAPAPPMDADAYFPSRLEQRQTKTTPKRSYKLSSLFGLLD